MLTPFIRRQLIAFGILTVISLLVLGIYYLQIPSLAGIGRYTLKADLPASALSLGEQKRLEVARALATGPDLLLCDEVCGGLSSSEAHDILELFRRLRAEGTTIPRPRASQRAFAATRSPSNWTARSRVRRSRALRLASDSDRRRT